jgi:ATP phosphoribosyltransferase
MVRPSDVPTYVQYGAADAGIAGKDVLLEHGSEGLYQPLDLGIGAAAWSWPRAARSTGRARCSAARAFAWPRST